MGIEDGSSTGCSRTQNRLQSRLRRRAPVLRERARSGAGDLTQADADAVFEAGSDEQALHDAIAVTARAMSCSD